jgi:hypothetical protein
MVGTLDGRTRSDLGRLLVGVARATPSGWRLR